MTDCKIHKLLKEMPVVGKVEVVNVSPLFEVVLSSDEYKIDSNKEFHERLAISYANYYSTEDDFEGVGGRTTKRQWIDYHSKRVGHQITGTIEVRSDGKTIHTVNVADV